MVSAAAPSEVVAAAVLVQRRRSLPSASDLALLIFEAPSAIARAGYQPFTSGFLPEAPTKRWNALVYEWELWFIIEIMERRRIKDWVLAAPRKELQRWSNGGGKVEIGGCVGTHSSFPRICNNYLYCNLIHY